MAWVAPLPPLGGSATLGFYVMNFHPLVQEWFERSFAGPTDAQELAWREIGVGRDVLISAPTGSGKTLAAFLSCLDRLVRSAIDGALLDETSVVYVSPL